MKKFFIIITMVLITSIYAENELHKATSNFATIEIKNNNFLQTNKNYKYIHQKRQEYWTDTAINILLFKDGVEKVMNSNIKLVTKDLILNPEEFNSYLEFHSSDKPETKLTEEMYKAINHNNIIKMDFIKYKKCDKDNLSIYGLKLGCKYYHQKDFKVTNPKSIKYAQNGNDLIIILNQEDKPYEIILITIVPSTNQIAEIKLYSYNPITKQASMTIGEAKKSFNKILENIKNKYQGDLKIYNDMGTFKNDKYHIFANYETTLQ